MVHKQVSLIGVLNYCFNAYLNLGTASPAGSRGSLNATPTKIIK